MDAFLKKHLGSPHGSSDMLDWPMADSVWPITVITVIYLLFVLKVGPAYMRNRKPMELRNVILGYNIMQIAMNAFMFYGGCHVISVAGEYTMGCIGRMTDTHPSRALTKLSFYCYFFNKILDYLDTVFFVLRKSDKQITFLHLYHHTVMVYTSYLLLHYYGTGGQHTFVGVMNSVVHVLMYSYYSMSAVYPAVKNTRWKQLITDVQIVQFLLAFVHLLWPVVMRPDCIYPQAWLIANLIQCFIMLSLFGNFYLKTYLKKRKQTAAAGGAKMHANGKPLKAS